MCIRDRYGLLAFAQSFINYFLILTDFGFNLSASREVAIHREKKGKLTEIFCSVMFAKFGLLLLSMVTMLIVVFTFEKFRQNWIIYLFAFVRVIGNVLFPSWFFQGMERMKYVTFLNIAIKLISTVLIFVIIRHPTDYLYVPLINSFGYLVADSISLWMVFRYFGIKAYIPTRSQILHYLKDSWQYFLSRVSVSIYTSSNAFVLGLFSTDLMTGYYASAEKLYTILTGAYEPISGSLYPYMSRLRNISLYKRLFSVVCLLNLIVCILSFAFAPQILSLVLGADYPISIDIFRIFLVSAVFLVPSVMLGYPFVAALGYPKYANASVVISSLVHILGLLILGITTSVNVYTVAVLVVVSGFVTLFVRVFAILKHNLWIQ